MPRILIHTLLMLSLFPALIQAQSSERASAREAFANASYREAFPYYARAAQSKGKKELRYRYGVCAVHVPAERADGMAVLEGLAGKGMPKAGFWVAVGHQLAGRHEKALDRFHRYRQSGDEEIPSSELERRIQMNVRAQVLRKKKVHVSSRRLRYAEDLEAGRAFLTHRGKHIFFQGADERGKGKGTVYLAQLQGAGIKLKDSLSFPEKELALAGIASNGNVIILEGERKQEGRLQKDLFFAEKKKEGWSELQAFGPSINSPADEISAWMSRSERLMIFSSAREGGNGGQDLYIVKLLPTGDWAKARYLSPVLNTPHEESFPCLMPDERTLYFLSNGHRSMGGRDIFRSFFKEESKRWVVPQQPGYPVNSSDHERAVSITANESSALITRAIAQAPFRRTEKVKLLYQDSHIEVLKGKVLDASNGDPVKAKLRVLDPKERSVQGIYRTRSDDGSFVLAIRPKKEYELIIEAEGYAPRTRKVSTAMEKVEVSLEEE